MNLAVILSVCVLCSAFPQGIRAAQTAASIEQQSSAGSAQGSQPATNSPTGQSEPATAAPPSQKTPAKPTAGAAKSKRRKKNLVTPKCVDQPAPTSTPSDASGNPSAQAASTPPAKCPPAKTVVREGSISETPIQLSGGVTAEQATDQRTTTDQLVGSTQDNLKKIEGKQLTSSELEMLNQIHQFLEQSKAAIAIGDIQRGHNLAMKAHLLSDELAKP